jgi:hypothetical protein
VAGVLSRPRHVLQMKADLCDRRGRALNSRDILDERHEEGTMGNYLLESRELMVRICTTIHTICANDAALRKKRGHAGQTCDAHQTGKTFTSRNRHFHTTTSSHFIRRRFSSISHTHLTTQSNHRNQ